MSLKYQIRAKKCRLKCFYLLGAEESSGEGAEQPHQDRREDDLEPDPRRFPLLLKLTEVPLLL